MRRTSRLTISMLLLTILLHQGAQGQVYEPPRTFNGKPDLQGTWSNASITTLERNVRYAESTLSNDEVIRATDDHPQNVRLATDDNMIAGQLPDGTDLGRGRGYNVFWIDPGTKFGLISGEYRTAWIVDPIDGRIPYNDAGRARKAMLREKTLASMVRRPDRWQKDVLVLACAQALL